MRCATVRKRTADARPAHFPGAPDRPAGPDGHVHPEIAARLFLSVRRSSTDAPGSNIADAVGQEQIFRDRCGLSAGIPSLAVANSRPTQTGHRRAARPRHNRGSAKSFLASIRNKGVSKRVNAKGVI